MIKQILKKIKVLIHRQEFYNSNYATDLIKKKTKNVNITEYTDIKLESSDIKEKPKRIRRKKSEIEQERKLIENKETDIKSPNKSSFIDEFNQTGELDLTKVKRRKKPENTNTVISKRKQRLQEEKDIVESKVKEQGYVESELPFHFNDELIAHFYFIHLCSVFEKLESTTKMQEKKNILTNFFRMIINPEYQNNEFLLRIIRLLLPSLSIKNPNAKYEDEISDNNIKQFQYFKYTFEGLLESYIKEYLNLDSDYIKEYLFSNNDISELIVNHYEPNKNIKEKLTINDILDFRQQIINTIGNGTMGEKLNILSSLYSKCSTKTECLYLTRILINKPRLGAGEKIIITAIENLVEDPEIKTEKNEYFFNCLVYLRDNLFHYNFSKFLLKDDFGPGRFFDVCLAKPEYLKSLINSIKKKKIYKEILSEVKYDGERTQCHFDKHSKLLFLASRAHEKQNDLYHELVKGLQVNLNKQKEVKNFIIDGEIVIYDTQQGRYGHFQDLRKKESNDLIHFKYQIIAFDILYLNNEPIYEKPLEERKKILHQYFFNLLPEIAIEEGQKFSLELTYDELVHNIKEEFKKAKALSCEGLIIKLLGNTTLYQFSKRHWYKIKAIDDSSIDSLDLIPIAGFLGLGEKKGLYSSFLMAIYDKKEDVYTALCFVGTGFTVDDLNLIFDRYSNNIIYEKPDNYLIGKSKPNIFFKPLEVWEIGFDNFTQSMNYPALKGYVSENLNLGISLRFPRFIRQRQDKKIYQATNNDELMSMYMNLYKSENKDSIVNSIDEEINNLV